MSRTLSTIRQTVKQLLKDEFAVGTDQDWTDDEIDVHIETCLNEVSDYSPYRSAEPLIVTAGSKLLDISEIEDLIGINRSEYPVGNDPRDYRNFEYVDNQTIEMKVDTAPSANGSSGTLTGTVTFTSGSPTVTGSGTSFTTELSKDYFIKPSGGARWYRVVSTESNTSLTLEESVKSSDAGADTSKPDPV